MTLVQTDLGAALAEHLAGDVIQNIAPARSRG